ncbi:hypothetical protein LSS_15016 [Leptospira santarosai serovar Shermani str. LT 821]|uniref:Uncharacterized protein n=1 Tax=Leptospira santarosai serovar Shermani str. LT 821 TaxID=758847 RepID=K8Y5K1_9LEPT|nr:hypothetical protein LSS_15016 [Leptospira santarosai serovar Shermani str. LT 821]
MFRKISSILPVISLFFRSTPRRSLSALIASAFVLLPSKTERIDSSKISL